MNVNKCCLVIFWACLIKMSFSDNMNIDVGGVIFHEKSELPAQKFNQMTKIVFTM